MFARNSFFAENDFTQMLTPLLKPDPKDGRRHGAPPSIFWVWFLNILGDRGKNKSKINKI